MSEYISNYEFYYERFLIKNYNAKVVLSMMKISNGNRRSTFTVAQLSKMSGESITKVRSAIYRMIDDYMINKLKIELIPAEYKSNELFTVQFPYDLENFSFLYENEINDLLELDDNEIKVFLMLFGFTKNSDEFKSKGLKQIFIGIDTISLYSGVKNLNTLTSIIKSLENKKYIKVIDKGNNIKKKNTKYEIIKDYKIR